MSKDNTHVFDCAAHAWEMFAAGYGWLTAFFGLPAISPDMDGAPRLRLYKKQPWPPAALGGVRKRLRSKTSPAAPLGGQSVEAPVAAALADETAADGDLIPLATSAKRTHVHWTHVRTRNPAHVQPAAMTRQMLWEHLAKVYAETYPDMSSPTGSILQFGMVVTERHKDALQEGHRHLHKHAATFCTKQHYWNKVAQLSLSKYNIPLNAVVHDSYDTMYAYLRRPTARKPLTELDAEPYLSALHPRGEALVQLLESGRKYAAIRGAKQQEEAQKRRRLSVFQDIASHNLRTAGELRVHAAGEAVAGRHNLADFCTRQGHKLEEVVENAWAVIEAPSQAGSATTLLGKMQHTAETQPCVCSGAWIPGAMKVLHRNGIDPAVFTGAVYQALEHGALRGTNVACVGAGGCGKSTLLEALENIFNCAPKLEKGSTFPFASLMDCDIMLWQDYEHEEKTVKFTDLLSWFVGESVGVRLPGRVNKKVRNQAPCFYSGHKLIEVSAGPHRSVEKAASLNGMMAERFTTFYFNAPLPMPERVLAWKHCGKCAATFYMRGVPAAGPEPGVASASSSGAPTVPPAPPAPASNPTIVDGLVELSRLYAAGALTSEEFTAAKSKILQ